MKTHRSFKGGGNLSLKEGKIGFMGKKGGVLPGKVLFTVRRSRALGK